jgi:UPF0755 protein
MRKLGCFALLLVLVAIISGFAGLQYWTWKGPLAQTTTIEIAPGTTLATASNQLEKAGAISSARQFRLFAKVLGADAPIKTGEYRIPAHISQSDLLKVLQGSKTLQRFVTIPEGWPSVKVKSELDGKTELTGQITVPIEGTILPDSYSFERGYKRQFMIDRMQQAMVKYLADAWEKRQPGLVVTTPREALILASIVEKETGKPSERSLVAAVYSNRLRRGMPLQADPTVIYPITKGLPLGRRILRSELEAKNGYNTYAMAGLPAGPICNPGRASIDAVLNPAKSNALYFVADGTGGHVFADTLEQHNVNVQKWYAIRRSRGEM